MVSEKDILSSGLEVQSFHALSQFFVLPEAFEMSSYWHTDLADCM